MQQAFVMGLCMAMRSSVRPDDDGARDGDEVGDTDPVRHLQVAAVIDDVRPGILADGGDVELVSIDDDSGVVTVRLTGACVGCPSATITMKFGIERIMLDRVPWVTAVTQVEEHEIPQWAEY